MRFYVLSALSQTSIESKISHLIDVFRAGFEKLTDEQKQLAMEIDNLSKPCQIHLISSPDGDYHLLLKTNFPELKDKMVRAVRLGNNIAKELEAFLQEPMWKSRYENSKFSSFLDGGSVLRMELVKFGKSILSNRKVPPQLKGRSVSSQLDDHTSAWSLFGDLPEIDFEQMARDAITRYKDDSSLESSKTQIAKPKEDIHAGFGTYFMPSLIIGDFNPSISDEIMSQEGKILKQVVFNDDINQTRLVISKGGLIGVNSGDEELAYRLINTFVGTCLVLGIPSFAVRKNEIANVRFDENFTNISGTTWSESSPRMKHFGSLASFWTPRENDMRLQISLDDLQIITQVLRTVWGNNEKEQLVNQLSNAYTQFADDMYSQTFISSWITIERDLYDLWMKKLRSSGTTKRNRDELDRWDLYHVIEILHLDKHVLEDDYIRLKQLQRIRNDVIHEGYEVTRKQAEDCYDLAKLITKKRLGINNELNASKRVFV